MAAANKDGRTKHTLLYLLAAILLLALGATLIVTSLTLTNHRAPAPVATFNSGDPDTSITPGAVPAGLQGARVSVPSLDLEVPWVTTGTAGGLLSIPAAPTAGWYDQSAKPGSTAGTTIIAAHVDFPDRSLTPFGHLAGIRKGDPVFVTDDDGTVHRYKVTALDVYKQQKLPASLFTRAGAPTLVLVTCSGDSVRAPSAGNSQWGYEENLAVTAVLVNAP